MTPDEIRQLRERLGMTMEEFARAVGVSLPSVSRWSRGITHPRGLQLKALQALTAQHRNGS